MLTYEPRDGVPATEPRDLDKGMFNERPLAVHPSAADWQKSPAGRAYLAGQNDATIDLDPSRWEK